LSFDTEVRLALVNAKAPLRALADVTLRVYGEEITIRRCAVFQRHGEPPWANFPGLPVERNGKKQFVPLIELSRDFKRRVLDAVLAEYKVKTNAH
jgi:DNA-binding cell septation regulator SpoVG